MSLGGFERGDSMDIRVYSGIWKVIGTRQPSYFMGIDQELTLNPDGTLSGGSMDWAGMAAVAYLNTFGSSSAISARNAATTYTGADLFATGGAFIQFGPNAGGTSFTFNTAYMNDGSFWFDIDGNGVYETHGADLGSGIALDLDFNGTYETSMVDFY